MSNATPHVPSYRLQTPSGQARVIIHGEHINLGKFGSPESLDKHGRLVAERAADGAAGVVQPDDSAESPPLSVSEVILAYGKFARSYYLKDGEPTRELENTTNALRPLQSLYGRTDGVYRIRFRVGGKEYLRSCETTEEKVANQIKARVEETLGQIKTGRPAIPADVEDVWAWVVSGGKITAKPKAKEAHTLKEVVDEYFASIPVGAKSDNSLLTERIHLNHFLEILKGSTPIDSIGVADAADG